MHCHCLVYLLSFENADTEDEREEKLVLFKQGATDIAVNAVCKMVIQVEDALFNVVSWCTVHDGLGEEEEEKSQHESTCYNTMLYIYVIKTQTHPRSFVQVKCREGNEENFYKALPG